MKEVLWWSNVLLALLAAGMFFIGLGQVGAVLFFCSVLCGAGLRWVR
jgi:hypothetical protein